MTKCIVDASVGIKFFIEEELSDLADILFSRLENCDNYHFMVPDLFFIECANVLWKRVRNNGYPLQQASGIISDMRKLAFETVPAVDLLDTALSLAAETGITVYDACYVALAGREDAFLITADDRLAERLNGTCYHVGKLRDLVRIMAL